MTMDEYFAETGIKVGFFREHLSPPVSVDTFQRWRSGVTPIPLERAEEIQKITRGRVKMTDWLKEKV